MKTKVIFRKWKTTGEVIALFPCEPATSDLTLCQSYMHVGQHGAACPAGVVRDTKPATPDEYRELEKELTAIGYDLEPLSRVPANAFRVRIDEATKQYARARGEALLARLRHHVTGAIERGEAEAITGIPA